MEFVLINAIIYVITLLLYWFKRRKIDILFLLLSLYTLVAVLGIPEVISEPNEWKIRLWPYIYLYIAFMLFFRPYYFDSDTLCVRLYVRNFKNLKFISTLIIVLSILTICCYLPVAVNNIVNGDWSAIRTDHYNDDIQIFSNRFEEFFANLSTHFRLAGTILFFYFLTIKDISSIRKILLSISVIVPPLLISCTSAARDILFELFFSLVICYIIFHKDIPTNIKKALTVTALFLFILMIIYSMAITMSRFGEGDQSSSSLVYYFSHSFLTFNYGLTDTINGHLYGDLFFGRIYDFFTGRVGPPITIDNAIGTHLTTAFFTFVGAWYIDFGPIGTFIIAIFLPMIISPFFKRKSQLKIADIYVYVFYLSYLIRGVFVHPRGIAFNWFVAVIVYFLLKVNFKVNKKI